MTTPRLLIRPAKPGDGKKFYQAINESRGHLRRWMNWDKNHLCVDDSEEYARNCLANWISRKDLTMFIFDRKTNKFLGATGLHRNKWDIGMFEVGYWVRKSSQGKGYITEAANAISRMAFQVLDAKKVELRTLVGNTSSINIAERLGFEKEGVIRNTHEDMSLPPKTSRDMIVYGMLSAKKLPPLKVNFKFGS